MKGFARILETFIAAIIIITSVAFFFPIAIRQSGWDAAVAELRAEDAISVGYKNRSVPIFVRNNDNTSLTNFFEKMFSKSIDFSVEIVGIPNAVIFVGCVCDDSQANDIKARLYPLIFTYKGRLIEIRVERVSVANIPDQTNILLFMDFGNLNDEYTNRQANIEKFIENGGTVFLLDDLTTANTATSVIRNLFNLTWNTQDNNPPENGRFRDSDNPDRIAYNIAKYYENITGHVAENENFQKFNTNGNTINQIVVDNRTVIETTNQKFSFAKGNRFVINGNGRAIWFAENDRSPEINNLTKASVMWASGERYKMDGAVKKTPPRVSQRASIIIHDSDTYEFRITTWNVF